MAHSHDNTEILEGYSVSLFGESNNTLSTEEDAHQVQKHEGRTDRLKFEEKRNTIKTPRELYCI